MRVLVGRLKWRYSGRDFDLKIFVPKIFTRGSFQRLAFDLFLMGVKVWISQSVKLEPKGEKVAAKKKLGDGKN